MVATILVVDDDPVTRLRLTRSLQKYGFATLDAGHGAAALQIMASRQVDLVLLDNLMPEISGLQVLTTLRKHFPSNQLPVVVLSAAHEADLVTEALRLGANDYLVKPVDSETLFDRITAQLGRAA